MAPQPADDQPIEAPRSKWRVGVEIPMSVGLGLLLAATAQIGISLNQFDELKKAMQEIKATNQVVGEKLIRIEQTNGYQEQKLTDHEDRLRNVERKNRT